MGLLAALGLAPAIHAALPDAAGDAAGKAPAPDKNAAAYQTAHAAIQKLVDALKAHPQTAHLGGPIAKAAAKLAAADGHAAKKEYKDAKVLIDEARTICVAAQKLAGEWVDYARRRATANALIYAFKGAGNEDWVKAQQAVLAAADLLANATPPKFAAAIKELKKIEDDTKPGLQDSIDTVRQRLHQAESSDAKTRAFLKTDIDNARPLVEKAQKAFAAGEWALAEQTSSAALSILGPAVRSIERRVKYDKQRAVTVAAIAKLRGHAPLQAQVVRLDAIVAKADALAAPEKMRIEEGLHLLVDAAARAGALAQAMPVILACGTERSAADAEIAALDAHAAAAKIAKERAAIHQLLAGAQQAAGAADNAADPVKGWNAVATALRRARADLAVAKKLADGLGPAAQAEAAAAHPADAKAMQAALAKLQVDGKAAAHAPHAAAAEAEFKRFEQRAGDAGKALAAGDAKTAAPALAQAAQALAAARTIQAEHAQFAANLAYVEAQLKPLQQSPRAAAIKARIDAVVVALADAKAKDHAHAGPAAIAAVRRASDAEAAARQADHDRAAFDTHAAALGKRAAAVKDTAARKKLDDALAEAKKGADGFDFAAAGKALDAVEVSLDKRHLDDMMKAKKPDEKGIAALADKMVKKGGAKTVDDMIQGVPNGGDPRLVNSLAKGRYGVNFSTGKPLAGGDEVKAMRTVCAMFSRIPQDVRGNPSIRGVSHEDAIPVPGKSGVGGGYAFDDGTIEMNGRPDVSNQEFGANLKAKDPKTNAQVPQLPAVEPACQPANTVSVDFLTFAAAHEVGHGVDDANGFMKIHGPDDKYGGWIDFGSSVQPLADIVSAHFALTTAPFKKYVLDTLQSVPSPRPATAVAAEVAALNEFDEWYGLATSKNIYRRQGDCDKIKIGEHIYHEAYTRKWVGYKAAARKKGLTGYQFRAPGEWFAELYAGFRSGKLGPNHPAREWLSKL